jgi:ribosomal RNA-processing protein 12
MDVYERSNGQGENDEVEHGKGGVEHDAQVLTQAATKILPSLFKLVETIHGTVTEKKSNSEQDAMDVDEDKPSVETPNVDSQRSQSVIDAIAALARLAPESFSQGLFKKVLQRLLTASQSDEIETEKICTLLRLSQALLLSQVLDDASVSLLYRAIKPLIRTDDHEARVQKRAYKVLLEICSCHTSFVTEPALLRELTALLLDSIMTSQVSPRHLRLKCMRLIVEGFDGVNEDHAVSNTIQLAQKLLVAASLTCFAPVSGCNRKDCSGSVALSEGLQWKGKGGCLSVTYLHGCSA